MHPCRSRGCKNIKGQSWRSIKNLPVQPVPGSSGSRLAALAIFLATSNFDLKYFCSLLTYKNVQYLIWKIWFISVWSLKPKAVVWLLTGFMLGQSTLISYHTETNGYIFFAAGVWCQDEWFKATYYVYLWIQGHRQNLFLIKSILAYCQTSHQIFSCTQNILNFWHFSSS